MLLKELIKKTKPTKKPTVSFLALPLSCLENHLLSFGSWFPHLRLLWRFSLPLRWGRSQMEVVAARSSTTQYWKENQTDKMRNFLLTNYVVIMLIFQSHHQSKSKSHLNGIYKRIRKWRKWGHISKPMGFHLSPFPFILLLFLTG